MNNFYKYIIKSKNSYKIVKGKEYYGSYKKLTDALYERDRLIESDWDWDGAMQIDECENKYENMDLPPFTRDYSYIHKSPSSYKVFKGREYLDFFVIKADAYKYAEEVGGVVYASNEKYRVQKSINGKTAYFGQYDTIEEAIARRDELIERGWET